MAGTKEKSVNGGKRELNGDERPAKKTKLLDNTDDEGSDSEDDGVALEPLKVNEEYAARFEHNKKRAERQRRTYEMLIW
jgi:protein KRI1